MEQWGDQAVEYVESYGIDLTLIEGDVAGLFRTTVHEATLGQVGARGELEAIARWQRDGGSVFVPDPDDRKRVTNPDFFLDGELVEVKTREGPLGNRWLKDKIRRAHDQIERSDLAASGQAELQLTGEAAAVPLAEIELQVRGQFTQSRSVALNRVAVYGDGELLGEWRRLQDGSVVRTFPGGS